MWFSYSLTTTAECLDNPLNSGFQGRGRPEKRLVVEILSDSEDEIIPPRKIPESTKDEPVTPGVKAMENLYKRICRDTLRSSPRSFTQENSPESEIDTMEQSDLPPTQLLNRNPDLLSIDASLERGRSSSRDSDETLILTRRRARSPEPRNPSPIIVSSLARTLII